MIHREKEIRVYLRKSAAEKVFSAFSAVILLEFRQG